MTETSTSMDYNSLLTAADASLYLYPFLFYYQDFNELFVLLEMYFTKVGLVSFDESGKINREFKSFVHPDWTGVFFPRIFVEPNSNSLIFGFEDFAYLWNIVIYELDTDTFKHVWTLDSRLWIRNLGLIDGNLFIMGLNDPEYCATQQLINLELLKNGYPSSDQFYAVTDSGITFTIEDNDNYTLSQPSPVATTSLVTLSGTDEVANIHDLTSYSTQQ